MKRSVIIVFLILPCICLLAQSEDEAYERKLKKFTKEIDETVKVWNAESINTTGIDWAPVYYENGIVYVSQYRSGEIDPETGETYYDLFSAEFDSEGSPSKPQIFSIQVNRELYEGAVCFNANQDKMYFTQNNNDGGIVRENDKDITVLKIYEATKGYFDWERIRELPFNDDNYNCMHPSLSPDGTKLFFASDMPGGYGRFDLYFVQNIDGNWSEPINLGPEINTGKDEVMPMIHNSGILFFSSKGHKGFGRYDLFMVDISTAIWGSVLNLGKPFNSEEDDVGVCLSDNGKSGFFTSARDGGYGKYDIYQFDAPEGIRGVSLSSTYQMQIRVIDEITGKPIPNVNLRFFEKSSLVNGTDELYDIEIQPIPDSDKTFNFRQKRKDEDELRSPDGHTDKGGAAYLPLMNGKDYIILASKIGYMTKEVDFIAKESSYVPSMEIKMKERKCMTLNGNVQAQGYKHRTLLGAKITIYNSCTGESQEVISNINGNFEACLVLGCNFDISAEKEGFKPKKTQISTRDTRQARFANVNILLSPESEAILKEPIRKGTKLILENIYYEFNSPALKSGSIKDLEKLLELMSKYPSVIIELGSHTDSRGTAMYNQNLSLQRAEAAKIYLVKRGVASGRIKVFGYGETQIRNHCLDDVKCTEQEHLYNRRTEVRILEINEPIDVVFRN